LALNQSKNTECPKFRNVGIKSVFALSWPDRAAVSIQSDRTVIKQRSIYLKLLYPYQYRHFAVICMPDVFPIGDVHLICRQQIADVSSTRILCAVKFTTQVFPLLRIHHIAVEMRPRKHTEFCVVVLILAHIFLQFRIE
jgi:hypothetical protein